MIVAVEREGPAGDDISALAGLGARRPWLAWPLTISMLALAGIPGTVGFIGKFQLINAMVNGDYTWLGIVLVIGSMISLGYYLRVIATMWMTPESTTAPSPGSAPALAPIAGGSPETDGEAWPAPVAAGSSEAADGGSGAVGAWRGTPGNPSPEATAVAVVFAAACVFFGIFPSPLFSLAAHAGRALGGLF